jgi:hypothetical protein
MPGRGNRLRQDSVQDIRGRALHLSHPGRGATGAPRLPPGEQYSCSFAGRRAFRPTLHQGYPPYLFSREVHHVYDRRCRCHPRCRHRLCCGGCPAQPQPGVHRCTLAHVLRQIIIWVAGGAESHRFPLLLFYQGPPWMVIRTKLWRPTRAAFGSLHSIIRRYVHEGPSISFPCYSRRQ